jgi:hypothetical protein
MYAGIIEVLAKDDHKLLLTFDNGERRLFDVAPYLAVGRFAELRNIEVFRKVGLSFDTIEWENGLDLDPEFLYDRSERILEPAEIS